MKKLLIFTIFLFCLSVTAQECRESIEENTKSKNLKLYKENSHASYYHDKFNGRKTASGVKFDNSKLTAAHKKLPFGTKLKITNEKNRKSVIVVINDRGPFVNGREIDLSKKAFMDITSNKSSGVVFVKIEIIEN
jgi:rare lipoprotein A